MDISLETQLILDSIADVKADVQAITGRLEKQDARLDGHEIALGECKATDSVLKWAVFGAGGGAVAALGGGLWYLIALHLK